MERRLDARDDLGEERIGDVADDEPDRVRLPSAEALGEHVRLVVELGYRLHHLFAHRRAHVGMTREDPRDGRHRDAGPLCDLAHAGPPSPS